ncbi:MAG: 2Fe-2S iron-sulfur cluster-binding protein [Armatimonadetes bacterium]|nr:2Fe-2S iron-sulfur cluster-binding protein [Armatimonadota bacterium]
MPTLTFQECTVECTPDETVLDALNRQGLEVPSSCRNGVCQTCLMHATEGNPPRTAQQGLKETLVAQGYFLACMCKPTESLTLCLPDDSVVQKVRARVIYKEYLNADILRLRLLPCGAFTYRAGQFVQIHRPNGLIRSYSIASVPTLDPLIELHVRLLPNGSMTTWIHKEVGEGDYVELSGAKGDCFYLQGNTTRNILLIGTGSGLAPLWGIVRSALYAGHKGEIHLYHGSWKPEGLYLEAELHALARDYPQFRYYPCVDDGAEAHHQQGRADKIALAQHKNLSGWQVYLCGHPEMVKSTKRNAFLAGANLPDIYADPFILSAPPK